VQSCESGVSEIVSTVLAIILVIALTAVIGSIFLGWAVPVQKTAYIVTEATPVTITNVSAVRLLMSQGETVSLAPATTSGIPVKFSLTNGSASYNFVPLPGTATQGWKPGASIILFRNTSGSWVADSTASVLNNTGFSNGTWTVNIIDAASNTIIASHTVNLIGSAATAPVSPPVASFIGAPVSGNAPLNVQFIDISTGGTPTTWSWTFGDGNTSTLQNPNNTYKAAGTYTVSLTATNAGGNNTKTQAGYITATKPGLTVWAWVKWINKPNVPVPSDQQWATVVLDGSSNANRRYHIQHDQNNTKFEFDIITVTAAKSGGQGVHVWSTTPLVNGTWYLVTGVYDQTPGTFAISVNGIQQASGNADNSGIRGSPGALQIGGIQAGYPNGKGICFAGSPSCADASRVRILNGSVYGVQTFDYVKNQTEILAQYNAQSHPA